jgi:hypothetical protein
MEGLMHFHITPKIVTDIVVYWAFFWNAIYVLAPPRETFNSPKYNKFLDLVSYYGSLNIRSVFMKAYGAQPSEAPSTAPSKVDGAPPKV